MLNIMLSLSLPQKKLETMSLFLGSAILCVAGQTINSSEHQFPCLWGILD